jgi:hypothetical protein
MELENENQQTLLMGSSMYVISTIMTKHTRSFWPHSLLDSLVHQDLQFSAHGDKKACRTEFTGTTSKYQTQVSGAITRTSDNAEIEFSVKLVSIASLLG